MKERVPVPEDATVKGASVEKLSTQDRHLRNACSSDASAEPPPSFAESEFHHIQRRQVNRHRSNLLKWSSVPSRYPNLSNAWEFAGWGSTYYMDLEQSDLDRYEDTQKQKTLIGTWRATSIAGNDLIASVLYSIGPCVLQAGKYAPISMLLIALLMYPTKNIINEVATSMPLNGGTYNAMLNTTAKSAAAVVACLSILDYLATSVVSASTATAYLAAQVTMPEHFSAFVLTIIILIVFSVICLFGIRESSTLTLSIFCLHTLTMVVVMITSVVAWVREGNHILIENWQMPDPPGVSPVRMIFNGVCIGLLGVTGFESAENYIEDMKPGTFPKLMNNMFGFLLALNAPMTFLVTVIVPVPVIQSNAAYAVSVLGEHVTKGQSWLRLWIMVDAVIVLCAGVLTGLIGAIGLIQRMASDRVLPRLFLVRNRFTGSYQYIILAFLILSITLYCITGGDTTSLSGVFAVAFLGNLSTFAFVNILMKYKRGRLRRMTHVKLITAVVTLALLVTALIGNIVINPLIAEYFVIYFGVVLLVILAMLNRGWLLKLFYWLFDQMDSIHRFTRFSTTVEAYLQKRIKQLRKQPAVFFLKTDEPHVMNKAILYIKNNEEAAHLKFVHIYDKMDDIPEHLEANHRMLDEVYPKIQVDLVFIQGQFDPATVDAVSRQLEIPKSLMFMSCPGKDFKYSLGEFEGVRIIML
ncbi:amino acid permease-domain-containing protein [Radiomyces spectabilis]|uniref:amino acid permease-domain-containing protein n=1 Tax=Radiomyces spectabilis TaxID=64574 RepID=UPI00221F9A26|nr:amino acid permease-domain-containing protein [Radiomyces spectabilis]KAI8384770.1 amino acid permease-domain-containing protein [Radiomyces spectabilis]